MAKLVLIVEDEAIIRMNAVAIVEDAGYDVVEASNADDAMVLMQTRQDIAAVFSDIEMPGSMNGLALMHEVRTGWPPVLLVLASGRITPPACDMPSETTFLQKPYSDAALLDALHAIH